MWLNQFHKPSPRKITIFNRWYVETINNPFEVVTSRSAAGFPKQETTAGHGKPHRGAGRMETTEKKPWKTEENDEQRGKNHGKLRNMRKDAT